MLRRKFYLADEAGVEGDGDQLLGWPGGMVAGVTDAVGDAPGEDEGENDDDCPDESWNRITPSWSVSVFFHYRCFLGLADF